MSTRTPPALAVPLWTHCVDSFDHLKNPISETLLGENAFCGSCTHVRVRFSAYGSSSGKPRPFFTKRRVLSSRAAKRSAAWILSCHRERERARVVVVLFHDSDGCAPLFRPCAAVPRAESSRLRPSPLLAMKVTSLDCITNHPCHRCHKILRVICFQTSTRQEMSPLIMVVDLMFAVIWVTVCPQG